MVLFLTLDTSYLFQRCIVHMLGFELKSPPKHLFVVSYAVFISLAVLLVKIRRMMTALRATNCLFFTTADTPKLA